MTDYDALAKKLKGMKKSGESAGKKLANYGFEPVTFYQYVKAQVEEEVDQANVELRKQNLPLIERVFIPSFQGKLSLTFGIGFLCTVELQEAKGRIRAVIFGPPIRDKTKAAGLPFIFKQVTSPCSGVGVNALGRVWHECPSPPLPFPWKPQPDIEAKHLYTVEQLKNLDDSGRPKGGYSPPYTRTRQEPISAKCIG